MMNSGTKFDKTCSYGEHINTSVGNILSVWH